MEITIQYFDDCPNWEDVDRDLRTLLSESGLDAEVRMQRIESHDDAIRFGFRGSPTLLIDGHDPFADSSAPIGLSCRIYRTETGLGGKPSVSQLREMLETHRLR